jgi:hypothetical protein
MILTRRIKEKFYDQYKNLIYDRALSFHKTTGFEFEELVCEGNLVFMNCLKDFNTNKNVSFSTYLYKGLNFGLYNFISSQMSLKRREANWGIKEDVNFIDKIIFDDIMNNLSCDGKKVYNFILQYRNKINKSIMIKHFTEKENWPYCKVLYIFEEIKNTLDFLKNF